jgi:tetratricopeptide (TPR) repeat protein
MNDIEETYQSAFELQLAGDSTAALELYEQCIVAAIPQSTTWAFAVGNSAIILARRGQLTAARDRFELARKALQDEGHHQIAVLQFARQGAAVLSEQGRFEEARDVLNQAIELNQGWRVLPSVQNGSNGVSLVAGMLREECYSLIQLGSIALRLHKPGDAKAILSSALHICEAHCAGDTDGIISICLNRGQAMRELGELREAIADLERAHQLAKESNNRHELARVDAVLGHLHMIDGRKKIGLMLIESSIDVAEQLKEQDAVIARRRMLAEQLVQNFGDHSGAWEQIQRALPFVSRSESSLIIAEFHQSAADVAIAKGERETEFEHLQLARTAWHQTIEQQLDPEIRASVAISASFVYRRLAAAFVERNQAVMAFEVFEEGRAAGLRAQLAALNASDVNESAVPCAGFLAVQRWILQRSATIPTALIALMYVPGKLIGIVVHPDGTVSTASNDATTEQLRSALDEYAALIPEENDKWPCFGIEPALPALCDLFNPLLERAARGVTHIMLLPWFSLWTLPWSVIFDRPDSSVTLVPSATWLVSQDSHPRDLRSTSVATIGVGAAGSQDLADECRTVAKLAGSTEIAIDGQATVEALRSFLTKPGIVHISAHGMWLAKLPGGGYIALADGRFAVKQIIDLRVLSSLVLLSACHSGRLHVTQSDDTIGLAPTLLARGASNVLATLWPVSAPAAMLFVAELINAVRGGAILPHAMLMARAETRKQYSDHREWGAFELFGAG